MGATSGLYGQSLALLTDLYQLTMAYGYWKLGMAGRDGVFHLTYRKNPFGGGFAVACGLEYVVDFLNGLRFGGEDLEYLGSIKGNDGKALFEKGYLDYLAAMKFSCDIDAMPEGTVAFPHEPLVRVKGPMLEAQIIETPLLNMINFQTLVATKSARVCLAARGEPVLEFGLRRAQGIDGALAASRAAYIGGCAATSNVLAGKLFGIPVKGTHAHSWVMTFEIEMEAFEAYAQVMPNNCVFLVDTYDTIEGVKKAVEVGKTLRQGGHEMQGIRLDSGDLAYLSIEARKILDQGGFPKAAIVASNDLDENIIASLKDQGAAINVWGVGTKLATAYDQPALGGVYKLGALKDEKGKWLHKVKLSEQTAKVSTPGILGVRRFWHADEFVGDAIHDELTPYSRPMTIVDPMDMTRRKIMPEGAKEEELLVPVFRGGKCVYKLPGIEEMRQRVREQLAGFHGGIKRFMNPHQYPVGLEKGLHELKMELVMRARGVKA